MNELDLLRRIIDGRVRPGQQNVATFADREPGKGPAGGGRPRMINRYYHSEEADHRYGLYDRGRYGSARYSPE